MQCHLSDQCIVYEYWPKIALIMPPRAPWVPCTKHKRSCTTSAKRVQKLKIHCFFVFLHDTLRGRLSQASMYISKGMCVHCCYYSRSTDLVDFEDKLSPPVHTRTLSRLAAALAHHHFFRYRCQLSVAPCSPMPMRITRCWWRHLQSIPSRVLL